MSGETFNDHAAKRPLTVLFSPGGEGEEWKIDEGKFLYVEEVPSNSCCVCIETSDDTRRLIRLEGVEAFKVRLVEDACRRKGVELDLTNDGIKALKNTEVALREDHTAADIPGVVYDPENLGFY